ncbi:MAG: ABC transporter substrate-binding protein [Candidatus Latescibacterota bacterium]
MGTTSRTTAAMPVVAALVALTACGQRQEPAGRPGRADLEQLDPRGREIVFWYQHNRQREEELLQLIEEFNAGNPYGFTVRGEYAGDYDGIYNKMIVGLQGGTLPHLVVAYQNQARAYHRDDGIVDLTPYMDSPRWGLSDSDRRDFYTAFLEQDRTAGVQTGFPPNRSIEVLYYNKDWLRELGYNGPPQTWEEFAQMCRKARDEPFSRSANRARSLGFMLEIDASRLASMVFSRGGSLVNEAGTRYTLDSPPVRDSLVLLRQLMRERAAEQMSEEYGDQAEFSVGQVLFALRSSSGLPFFATAVESGVEFDWDVTYPPHSTEKPAVNVYGASISVCRTTPEDQLASWLFIKWFTQPAQQARWVRASDYFPVRRSTARELQTYFAENPRYRSAFELLEYGRSEPSLAGYQQVRRLLEEAMVDVFDGGDVDRILARAEEAANRTLASEGTGNH